MPAIYPPIAPRRGEPPTRPDSTDSLSQELQPVDAAGQAPRLAALEADPSTFVDAHHPVRDAVAIALLKPAGELIKRYAARQMAHKEAISAPLDSDDPTERPMPLASDDGLPAILAMAETQVAMALLGDAKAFAAIADRVEGKAGLRKADLDAETEAQRQRVRGTIEELVREMGERRRVASDDARVIDVEVDER
jgi:hypothetical protein